MASSNVTAFVKDLALVPELTFAFVEDFIKSHSTSSGKEQMTKGFKYYSEQYVHAVLVYEDEEGCLVKGKCYRSQRKNYSPHDVKVLLKHEKVEYSFCTCTIGQSGYCGHVTALLYQLAYYKLMEFKLIPTDIARTSMPQTWHFPRGEKLHGEKVDNIIVQGYDRNDPQRATKGIKSTLYNPLCGEEEYDIDSFLHEIKDMNILFNTSVENTSERVQTKFGKFKKGSVLSYQQKLANDYLLNLMEVNDFPNLPVQNVMKDNVSIVLSENQLKKFDSLKLTEVEVVEIEESTRNQSKDPKWHKLRQSRITASSAGEIAKRRADGKKLADRLHTARCFQSAAMKRGIECEVVAAQAYSEKMDNDVNLYPSGVVVSPYSHWLAATPDRKVYCPSRDPPFGLLEIKCPDTDDLSQVKCLREDNGQWKLKRNDNYYYQVQMQMAVTGLEWCDFYVWLDNASHLETIHFDEEFWQSVKDKLDLFFFNYFLE